jgi:hypothetical protein
MRGFWGVWRGGVRSMKRKMISLASNSVRSLLIERGKTTVL